MRSILLNCLSSPVRRFFLKSLIVISSAWSLSALAVPIVNFGFSGLVTGTTSSGGFPPIIDPTIAALGDALQNRRVNGQVEYLRNAPSVLSSTGVRSFSTDVNVTFQSNVLSSPPYYTYISGEATEDGGVTVQDNCTTCPIPMDVISIYANGSPIDPFTLFGYPLIPGGVSDVYITSLSINLSRSDYLRSSPPYIGFPNETPGIEDLFPISQFTVDSNILIQMRNYTTGGIGSLRIGLDSIYAVPEPGSLPLLSFGLALLFVRRLRAR